MNVYQESGYVDIRNILDAGFPFIFMVGGRGTGKTYTSLETVIKDDVKFMFMRRTQTQVDVINNPEYNPFKKLNSNKGWSIGTSTISKGTAGFYEMEEVDGKMKCKGSVKGYTCALSTIANTRGFDASDVNLLIYDEFIPEKHERPIKNEASAFFNAIETINRNRELEGDKPLQVLCLSNANDLGNAIFMELKLIRKAEQMKKKGQGVYEDRERGILLIVLADSKISELKKDTALYRMTKGTSFEQMSIGNAFSNEEIGKIKSRPLNEYKPIVAVGELCIYKHKSNRSYYVSTHKMGTPVEFGVGDMEKARFRRSYGWVWEEYLKNNIDFEEYLCEILLTKYYS